MSYLILQFPPECHILSACLICYKQVEKVAQNQGFTTTRVTFHPEDRGFFVTSGSTHLRLWCASSDDVLKAYNIPAPSKEQARQTNCCRWKRENLVHDFLGNVLEVQHCNLLVNI